MSLLKPMHPGARITDGYLVRVVEADLAHDVSTEKRDSHGRWTDGSSAKFPDQPSLTEVSDAYGWPDIEAAGSDGTKMTTTSVKVQEAAQVRSKMWDGTVSDKSPDEDQYAADLWEQYQAPSMYGLINDTLRGIGTPIPGNPDAATLRHYAETAFQQGGTTTKEPTVFYHAIKSHKDDWSKKFVPGQVFEDDGFVSATAFPRFAQGWLALKPGEDGNSGKPRPVSEKDVVVEMRVPAGTRVMGGNPEFIETMFHPGTKMKVVSVEKRKATNASSPLGDFEDPAFTYTHVIAEVQP